MLLKNGNLPTIIGVIGGNTCSPEIYELAYQVGKYLAGANAILVCGGMGGVMEAACKGAVEAGGTTVGILPSDSIDQANPYVQIPVATGMGIGRNIIIARTARGLIAVDGKYGTLSEIAFALQLNKPVVALEPWINIPGLHLTDRPEEAVNWILSAISFPED